MLIRQRQIFSQLDTIAELSVTIFPTMESSFLTIIRQGKSQMNVKQMQDSNSSKDCKIWMHNRLNYLSNLLSSNIFHNGHIYTSSYGDLAMHYVAKWGAKVMLRSHGLTCAHSYVAIVVHSTQYNVPLE